MNRIVPDTATEKMTDDVLDGAIYEEFIEASPNGGMVSREQLEAALARAIFVVGNLPDSTDDMQVINIAIRAAFEAIGLEISDE